MHHPAANKSVTAQTVDWSAVTTIVATMNYTSGVQPLTPAHMPSCGVAHYDDQHMYDVYTIVN